MEGAIHLEKKSGNFGGSKSGFLIDKKLFHLVLNPGAVPVTRRDAKMAAELVIILDELVDEEIEI